jgi:ADP-ribose pyrophosphatase
MFKILNEKIIFSDRLIIEKGEIIDKHNNKFDRYRLKRPDASAVLVFNTEAHKIILTKQFRYAISSKTKELILEIVAGKIDEGEEPLQTAIRETEEEVGYRINPENIELLVSCFASPGYSAERFFIYYATVTNSDKISKGGGLKSENEYINVVEMDLEEFNNLIKKGSIEDAKTYIAGMYLALHKF